MALSEELMKRVEESINRLTTSEEKIDVAENGRKSKIQGFFEEVGENNRLISLFTKVKFRGNLDPKIIFLNSLCPLELHPYNRSVFTSADQLAYSNEGLLAHVVDGDRRFYQRVSSSDALDFVEALGREKDRKLTADYVIRCFEYSLDTFLSSLG